MSGGGAPGDKAQLAIGETGSAAGVIYFVNASTIGVRAPDAFYRFLRGFGHPVVAAHQLFAPDANPEYAARAWQSWLSRVLNPKEQLS